MRDGQTSDMRLRVLPQGGRTLVVTDINVQMTGESVCLTTDCAVKGLRLVFSNLSRQSVQLRVLPATIRAGNEVFQIPAQDLMRATDAMPAGPFLKTLVPNTFIARLVGEQEVTITMGSVSFALSHSDRAPLRALVEQMGVALPTTLSGTP